VVTHRGNRDEDITKKKFEICGENEGDKNEKKKKYRGMGPREKHPER